MSSALAFVPYSPLGRGALTGAIKTTDDLAEDDFRRRNPRFRDENLRRNVELIERVESIAAEKGVTAAQLALAWVMAQGDDVVPIPGTKRVRYLEQNAAAAAVALDEDDLRRFDDAFPPGATAGDRYPDMTRVNIEAPLPESL